MQLYKIVGTKGEPLNGGTGRWPMPKGDQPGDWRTIDGPLEECRNGLHLTDAAHLETWLPRSAAYGPAPSGYIVLRAETDGPVVNAGQKYVAGKVRLHPRRLPMPDIAAAYETHATAKRRADDRMARANTAAGAWGRYWRATGGGKPAPDHPAAASLAAIVAAEDAHRRAYRRADATLARAMRALVEGA